MLTLGHGLNDALQKLDTDEKIQDRSMTNDELHPIQALPALGKPSLEWSGL